MNPCFGCTVGFWECTSELERPTNATNKFQLPLASTIYRSLVMSITMCCWCIPHCTSISTIHCINTHKCSPVITGATRMMKDIERMTSDLGKSRYWWLTTWLVLCPVSTLVVIGGTFYWLFSDPAAHLKELPLGGILFGAGFGLLSIIPLPLYAVLAIHKYGFDRKKVSVLSRIRCAVYACIRLIPCSVHRTVRR